MRYREIQPSARLRSFIESYWILEQDAHAGAPQRVVPDGHPELILNLGEPFEALREGHWERQPRCFLAGQIDGPLLLRPNGRARIIGVRFQPHGAAQLFGGAPMHELAGRFTPVEGLASTLSRDLERALDSRDPMTNLERVFERGERPHDPRIPAAIHRITLERGQSDLARLARDLSLSVRQFERRFSASVGLSPKLFCRMRRFLQVFQVIGEQPSKWADAAVACGYYDQSHLIRDCKEFTGETPALVMAEEADLARHFLLRFGVSHSSNTSLRRSM